MESLFVINIRRLDRTTIRGVEIYVATLVLLLLFRHSTVQSETFLKWPLITMGLPLLIFCFWNYLVDKRIIAIMIAYASLVLASGLFYNDVNVYNLMTTVLVFFPIALFFLCSRQLSVWCWSFLYLLVCVLLFYKMHNSPDGYLLFYATSRNYVSVYSIIALSICSFSIHKENKKLPIAFLLIIFFLAIYSVGRGGILSTGILLGLFMIYRAFIAEGYNRQLRILISVFFFIALGLIVIYNYELILNKYFMRFIDSSAEGSNNERLAILRTYFEGVLTSPPQMVFFGIQPTDLGGPFARVGWNIHNSFLQFYATTGLLGIIALVVLILKAARYLFKQHRVEELFVFLVFLLRSGTDYVFPENVGDIVLLYYILLPWQERLIDSKQ